MGKAITAFQDRALAEQIVEVYGLSRRTEFTITDRARLFDEFAQIRSTGVACDRQESILGGICYSAALHPAEGPVVAAISLSTPVVRMTPEREEETRKAVLEAAVRASAALNRWRDARLKLSGSNFHGAFAPRRLFFLSPSQHSLALPARMTRFPCQSRPSLSRPFAISQEPAGTGR